MFTKVFLKSSRIRKICIFLLIVLLAALHTTGIAWVRSGLPPESPFVCPTNEKITRNVSAIFQKRTDLPSEELDVTEPEQSLKTFIVDEVLRVCTEVYPDLDPNYVLAIIQHESRFNPKAVNPKSNATGLMQILPKWHTARAQRLGVELTDPAGNILVGCDILNEVCQQSGSFRYALNVYAGGYSYANNHKNTKSQFEKELDEIIESGVLYSVGR